MIAAGHLSCGAFSSAVPTTDHADFSISGDKLVNILEIICVLLMNCYGSYYLICVNVLTYVCIICTLYMYIGEKLR